MQTLYNIPGVGEIPSGVPFDMMTTLDDGVNEPYEDLVSYPANWLVKAETRTS